MIETHVLLVHGMTGAGPWHWQRWLAGALAEHEVTVHLPELPDPDRPLLRAWLPALRNALRAVPEDAELVVAAHSCGSALWLHHTASFDERETRRANRVLLVSPPSRSWSDPYAEGITPYPVDALALRRAGGVSRLVAGSDDPLLPLAEAHALAAELRIDLDVLSGGAHLNTAAGYGPWPAVLSWALYAAIPLRPRPAERPRTTERAGRRAQLQSAQLQSAQTQSAQLQSAQPQMSRVGRRPMGRGQVPAR